jgi:hypothetical protein
MDVKQVAACKNLFSNVSEKILGKHRADKRLCLFEERAQVPQGLLNDPQVPAKTRSVGLVIPLQITVLSDFKGLLAKCVFFLEKRPSVIYN